MNEIDTQSSVFADYDISISKLKSCAFFWKNIIVYESFIQEIPHKENEKDEFYDFSRLLFENGILKIAMRGNKDLSHNLMDKIYAGMDGDFYEFLYANSNKICVNTKVPPNLELLVNDSSDVEYKDEKLKRLLDSTFYKSIEEEISEDFNIFGKTPIEKFPPDFQRYVSKGIEEFVSLRYSHYEKLDQKQRYSFEWKNENLLIKNSISSAILTSKYQLAYYNYKFNNFREKDANCFIEGLKACMPFVKRDTVDDFSFNDILQIRKNKKWKKAMERLGEICNNVKYEIETEQFKDEIRNELVSDYQDSLDEYRVKETDLLKDLGKNVALTGVSFVPLVGPAVSAIGSGADSVKSYLVEKNKQKNLPFFLNDIKKM